MARSNSRYICLPCRDENGKAAVPATHRLLVREVGETLGDEVWGCHVHISELYAHLLRTGKPLDVIVHNTVTGRCVFEAHPRLVGDAGWLFPDAVWFETRMASQGRRI